MRFVLVLCLVTFPLAAFSAVTSPLDTNKDGKVDAAETAAAIATEATTADVVKDGAGAVIASKGVIDRNKADSPPLSLLITVLLGAIFKLLLSLIKVLAKNVAWFKTQEGKRVIKYSTIGLGSAAALTANLAMGLNWVEALTILLSGPLAVAIHEYTSDSRPATLPTTPAGAPSV